MEAQKAYNMGEVPVGAIIVTLQGQIIAKTHNLTESSKNPCAHAEILAISNASSYIASPKLSNCILLTTLEPCLMCTGAISLSRLSGLVFGAWDSQAGALASYSEFPNLPLNNHGLWYMGGICADSCITLLKDFFNNLR